LKKYDNKTGVKEKREKVRETQLLNKADKVIKKTKTQKQIKASNKIIRLYNNTLKFKIVNKQQAFKNKVEQITLTPSILGSLMASDIDAVFARSYIIARRQIPRNAEFKLYCSCSGDGLDTGELFHFNITTSDFSSKELNKFFNDLMERIHRVIQSNTIILLSTLKIVYNFAIIPSGGSCGTRCREIESIINKTSVIQMINDDNNCFWYCMAILFDVKNRQLKDSRNKNIRIKAGMNICNKSKCRWDKPVSLLEIPLVEETYNCNIYLIDIHNLPMLGKTISLLLNCLLYKSEDRNSHKYFLLFDTEKQHYHCITDIKKFLGVREFCYKCLKGFYRKSSFEIHECNTTCVKKNTNCKNDQKCQMN
jgi:hypothetical protein